ncbi:MAG: type II toxin-antitoxin system death-on-curing family toxin [Rhodospirillales bacterium]
MAIVWIGEPVVLAIHDEQLAEHGGAPGLRDAGLLKSTLARPQNLQAYGDSPDLPQIAAAYGYGLARNHPFIDGNKRTALVVAELFLALNGLRLNADDEAVVLTVLDVAAGSRSEPAFAEWIRNHG